MIFTVLCLVLSYRTRNIIKNGKSYKPNLSSCTSSFTNQRLNTLKVQTVFQNLIYLSQHTNIHRRMCILPLSSISLVKKENIRVNLSILSVYQFYCRPPQLRILLYFRLLFSLQTACRLKESTNYEQNSCYYC